MTEKQRERRMKEAWEMYYNSHDMEAEWYGMDDEHIWVCDIPSISITVKMVLDEQSRKITIYKAPMEKQVRYDYVRETCWEIRGYYNW